MCIRDRLGHTRENLEGVRVIRAFNKQESEIDSFNTDNEALTAMQMLVGRISALTNPITFVIINCATLVVIFTGGKQVYGGMITQGEVVALVNYMSQILVELIKLANLIVQVTKAVASGNRIADILAIEPSIKSTESGNTPAKKENCSEVVFENVCMTYAGAVSYTHLDVYKRQGRISCKTGFR